MSGLINSRKSSVGVEFYIYEDKELFASAFEKKEQIEHELGMELEWMELPERKSSRVLLSRKGEFNDPAQRAELVEWIYQTAEKFSKVFQKYT